MVLRKPLTVGQVAGVLHVSNKTVLNWIHAGALKAFTTFGGHFRIWPADLERFLRSSNMSISFEYVDAQQSTVLIIDDDSDYAKSLQKALRDCLSKTSVLASVDGYEGILMIGEHKPGVLILGVDSPESTSLHILELLKSRKRKNGMKIVLLCQGEELTARFKLRDSIADCAMEKTVDPEAVLSTLGKLLGKNSDSPQGK